MILSDFLPMLEKVKGRGEKFVALCPAHGDKSPSLSIREGEKGILVKCWSGCSTNDIALALGLSMKDLFYDSGLAHFDREAIHRRKREKEKGKKIEQAKDRRIDLCREAEATIRAASGIDISKWTSEELNRALNALAPAYSILLKEERQNYVE